MIQGRERVIEWMRLNQTKYWKVRDFRGNNIIATSAMLEDLTFEQSIEALERLFDTIGQGRYMIEAWEKHGQTKEWKRVEFDIGFSQPENQTAVAGIGALQVEETIARKLEEYKTQLQIEQQIAKIAELEARNKELELELNSVEKRIYHRVSPFIGTIYKALGIEADTETHSSVGSISPEDAQNRLEAAFELWQKNENSCVEIIEKIAHMSEHDKQMYNVARGVLMK